MLPLKENILEQQQQLHDVKVECFTEIQRMAEKVKALEKHLEIVSHINLKMVSLQAKIKEIGKWRNVEKSVPSSLPVVKTYDIRLHTLATNECQELASQFEEKARKSLEGIRDVYEKSISDVQRYLQWSEINFRDEHMVWPEINFRDEHMVSFAFFQDLKDKCEMIKVEVKAKEVISKDNIEEFLVKPLMDFSHYTTFVHKFVVDMEKFKECNLSLDVNKKHIFNSWEQRILTQHEAWSKYFQNKGG